MDIDLDSENEEGRMNPGPPRTSSPTSDFGRQGDQENVRGRLDTTSERQTSAPLNPMQSLDDEDDIWASLDELDNSATHSSNQALATEKSSASVSRDEDDEMWGVLDEMEAEQRSAGQESAGLGGEGTNDRDWENMYE